MPQPLWFHKQTRNMVLVVGWFLLFVSWYGGTILPGILGLCLINLYTFVLAGRDKRAARRGDVRVPEASLWLLSILGGAAGLFVAMLFFRHKTRHLSFRVGVPVLLCIQLFALYFVR